MSQDELSKLKKSLRSVLISCPEGTPVNKVEHDYRTFMGCALNFRQFGFSSIDAFLRSIPDVVKLSGPIAYGVACDEIKHVTKLINNQRKVTSNLKKVQRAREVSRQQHVAYGPPPPHGKFWNGPHPLYHPIPPMPHMHYQHVNHQSHGSHFPPRYHGQPDAHRPPTNPFYMQPPPPPQPRPPPRVHQPPPFSPPPVSPAPAPDQSGNELIFSEREIVELLTQQKIHNSKSVVHILSLTFPYIYKGSHVAILDLSIPLCIDLATAVAFDCEEELEGTPAILVCKMQDFHDFKLLESSPKVQRFNSANFRDTASKVLTINFQEMLNLLNSNNEHFYKSTTFVIFVDLLPAHMPLLENLLPPELQYLFLLTSGRDFSFKLPHIVLRRWGTDFTDVAYNGEKCIDRLQAKLTLLNPTLPSPVLPPSPTVKQAPPNSQQKPAKPAPVANGKPPVRTNGATPDKVPTSALRHLTEIPYKAKMNLFIQAGPVKGKTALLLEFALDRVDVTLDKLQIVLTAPNPNSAGQLFLRLKEYVNLKGITEVRAFGYTEGSFDKLNLYITEQKVHILVIENAHLLSLMLKNPTILNHCKLLGCDELYGAFYTKQVPTTVARCFGKLKLDTTQIITVSRQSEKEDLLQTHLPKPFWHIKEENGNDEHKEKYLVTFFNKC